MSGGGGPDDEKSFKSRVSDVFAGLDQVGFKSDSSLKQQDKPKEKEVEDKFKEFRRPRSPPERQGFDRFKRTDSIFQETPDVGSWRQRGDRRPPGREEQRRPPPRNKPKNPLYDSRRPQRKDPSKYTKYSLADVKDVTDRSNTAAALDFLDSCRKRRQAEDAADDDDGPSSSKVVFKKPKRAPPPAATADPPPKTEPSSYGLSCGNSKRVMPEAVVGLRPSANKRKTEDKKPAATKAAAAKKEKKLSHLDFEDDEEDC